jgi:hypothetical protein
MPNYLAFIDESGDHNLKKSSLDGLYNVFVLVAIVFEESSYHLFDQHLKAIKQNFR